jgi:hypothetical protein
MSSNIAWVHKGRYSRPRRITKLSVDSVDVVDHGAGIGTNIKIMKRDQQEDNMSTRETIAKSFQLRAQGRLSDFDLGILHQRRAAELGMTLAKYYDSDEGRQARDTAIVTKNYADQVRSAHGDGWRVAKKMEREEPFDKEPRVHAVSGGSPVGDDDDGDDDGQVARQIEGMVMRLMEKNPGMTKDQAHLHIAATPEGKALLSRAHQAAVSKNMR